MKWPSRSGPAVVVVCPIHNRGERVSTTIESALGQSGVDVEFVAVLDRCDDDSKRWVERTITGNLSAHLIETDFGHPSAARNAGFLTAGAAPYVAFLDHDDTWLPDHLITSIEVLAHGPSSLVATAWDHKDENVRTTIHPSQMYWHPTLHQLSPLFQASVVTMKREAFERSGGWRVVDGLEDWDLWIRLVGSGERFATLSRSSTIVERGVTTRRHGLSFPVRNPIAVFRDPQSAREFATACEEESIDDNVRELTTYLELLDDRGELVRPSDAPSPFREIEPPVLVGGPERFMVLRDGSSYVVAVATSLPGHEYLYNFREMTKTIFQQESLRRGALTKRFGGRQVSLGQNTPLADRSKGSL